jgi:hypothetical protein
MIPLAVVTGACLLLSLFSVVLALFAIGRAERIEQRLKAASLPIERSAPQAAQRPVGHPMVDRPVTRH